LLPHPAGAGLLAMTVDISGYGCLRAVVPCGSLALLPLKYLYCMVIAGKNMAAPSLQRYVEAILINRYCRHSGQAGWISRGMRTVVTCGSFAHFTTQVSLLNGYCAPGTTQSQSLLSLHLNRHWRRASDSGLCSQHRQTKRVDAIIRFNFTVLAP